MTYNVATHNIWQFTHSQLSLYYVPSNNSCGVYVHMSGTSVKGRQNIGRENQPRSAAAFRFLQFKDSGARLAPCKKKIRHGRGVPPPSLRPFLTPLSNSGQTTTPCGRVRTRIIMFFGLSHLLLSGVSALIRFLRKLRKLGSHMTQTTPQDIFLKGLRWHSFSRKPSKRLGAVSVNIPSDALSWPHQGRGAELEIYYL